MQLNPSEISELIKAKIENLGASSELRTQGTIVSVTDGIVRIHGLSDVMSGEMIEMPGNTFGVALNLERDSVGAVILGDYEPPLALKMLGERLPHKTEAGAVRLGLGDATAVAAAVARMRRDVAAYDPEAPTDRFLLERMVGPPVAELMVSVRRDRDFGFAMTLASGGVLVELVGDAVTLLLPAGRAEIAAALDRLKVARLMAGFRGRPAADRDAVLDLLERIAARAAAPDAAILELEINPLLLLPDGACAVDVLLRRAAPTA